MQCLWLCWRVLSDTFALFLASHQIIISAPSHDILLLLHGSGTSLSASPRCHHWSCQRTFVEFDNAIRIYANQTHYCPLSIVKTLVVTRRRPLLGHCKTSRWFVYSSVTITIPGVLVTPHRQNSSVGSRSSVGKIVG